MARVSGERPMNFAARADRMNAFIFDLDGVVTETQTLHMAAWKRMFDEYLRKRSGNVRFEPFEERDYREFVDGKPRYDGVRDFLASRRISLREGSEQDSPDEETVCGLGNRKNDYYLQLLNEKGAKVYETSIEFIRRVRDAGLKTAIISSSKNLPAILESTDTGSLFDARVDGNDLGRLKIPGKPDPSMFLEAARRLHVEPEHAAIVEDAIAGVEAGRRGGFGLVIGVARSQNASALKAHGADVTVEDLGELADEVQKARKV